MEILSDRIRALRIKHDLSQQDLADLLYLDRTTIAGYETCKREPSLHILIQIADIFDVSVDYLLGRD